MWWLCFSLDMHFCYKWVLEKPKIMRPENLYLICFLTPKSDYWKDDENCAIGIYIPNSSHLVLKVYVFWNSYKKRCIKLLYMPPVAYNFAVFVFLPLFDIQLLISEKLSIPFIYLFILLRLTLFYRIFLIRKLTITWVHFFPFHTC